MPRRRRRRTVLSVATTDEPAAPAEVAPSGETPGGWWAPGGALGRWGPNVLLAAAIGLFEVLVTRAAGDHQPERQALDVWGALLLLVGPAALVVRRRWPVGVYLVTFASTFAYWLTDYPRGPIFLALVVAFVNLVLTGHRTVAWAGLAVGYALFGWVRPLYSDEDWPSLVQAFGLAAWLLVLGTGAEILRIRRERRDELAHTRAEEARRRASEERLLIARELHDVLAHNISLINVQAGVALHLLDEHPDQARPALAAIKDASGEALGELRSVLDVLRRGDDGLTAPRTPAAGLRDLEDLVARTRATGLDVRLEVSGEVQPVPAGVGLAAFRIAQEALTNVVRHADAGRVTVRLGYGPGELTVQVDDDGQGGRGVADAGSRAAPGSGKGIAGMRERVRALGGEFEAGQRPGRGFRVRARLPIGGAPG
jgi:signal transduction histidine kinase